MESESKLVCSTCKKTFSSVSTKNRHLKTVHNQKVEEKMSQYIKCPLCPEEKKQPFPNHDSLLHHLTEVHSVIIKESKLNFRNLKEFEAWRAEENREVDYACSRKIKHPSGEDYLYYNCNRADSRGFKSTCTKRAMKAGGSIRISGICPSRISAKILINGMISVKFIETHVGHEDELRTKRLLKKEQTMIVEQLNAGVSNERILQDAKIINSNKLERINLIRRADLRYLTRKFNIDKQRNEDDMIATALKVEVEDSKTISSERSTQVMREEVLNYANSADRESLEKLTGMVRTLKKNVKQESVNKLCKKRKIEKQTYYPNKK